MDQEFLKRIIVALYKRLCAGTLLVIIPELPWGSDSLTHLLRCLERFGWRTEISTASGISIPDQGPWKRLQTGEPVDLSLYERIWIPALPLNVLARLKQVSPSNRQEAMILEALAAGMPVGAPQGSWLPPTIRSRSEAATGCSAVLNGQLADLCGTLNSWGLQWVSEGESGSWILGAQTGARETVWQEPVLHGAAVRMLQEEVQVLRIQKGTVVTAAARDELSRRRIRLVGDR